MLEGAARFPAEPYRGRTFDWAHRASMKLIGELTSAPMNIAPIARSRLYGITGFPRSVEGLYLRHGK
jgi:hypothetical protein